MAKTNWTMNDTVKPEDMNAIGQEVNNLTADGSATDARIGDRTISDSTVPTGDKGKLTALLGWMANMIKSITGKPNWRTAPRTTLENTVKRDGDTMTGQLTMDTGSSNAISLKGGNSNHVYMQYYADAADQAQRSAFVGFGSSGSSTFSIANERNDGDVAITTKGTGSMKVNSSVVHHAGNHNSTGDPHSQYLLKAGGTVSGPLVVNQSVSAGSSAGRNLIAGPWGDLSSNGDGHLLLAGNAYTTGNNEYRYAKTHSTVGARGLRFSAFGGGLLFFETGQKETMADEVFAPAWKTMLHDGNHNNSGDPHSQYLLKAGGKITGHTNVEANMIFAPKAPTGLSSSRQIYFQYRDSAGELHDNSFLQANTDGSLAYYRDGAGGTIYTNANHGSLGDPHSQYSLKQTTPQTSVVSGDLNNIVTSGMYRLQQSHTNAPPAMNYQYGNMLVLRAPNADSIAQIVFPYNNGRIMFRRGNPSEVGGIGEWSPWRNIWTEDSDGSGSGLDADLLDGLHASWSADANTVVARNSNGDVTARAYKSTISNGTPPLIVVSSTKVGNLNADMLDNYHASYSNSANTIPVRDGTGKIDSSQFNAISPSNPEASVHLAWFQDVARLRVGGNGTGILNGFEIHGPSDTKLFRTSHNGQWTNYTSQGTPPLVVSSTTRVQNLNADMLDDCHATSSPTPSTVAIRGPQGTLKAATPVANDDLTTKQYTDSLVTQKAVPIGANNQALAFVKSLLMPTDTRSWTATAWDGDKPTTILIKDGTTTVCTLTMTYLNDNLSTLVATAGSTRVTWTLTWNGDKFVSFTKAVA